MTLLLPLIAFVLGASLIGAVGLALAREGASPLERRLSEVTGVAVASADEHAAFERAAATLKRLSRYAPSASAKEIGKLRLRLQKRNRLRHWIDIRQAVVGFIKKKTVTIPKSRACRRARNVYAVAERPTVRQALDQHEIVSGMIIAPRFEKLETAIVRARFENNNGRAESRAPERLGH